MANDELKIKYGVPTIQSLSLFERTVSQVLIQGQS